MLALIPGKVKEFVFSNEGVCFFKRLLGYIYIKLLLKPI